MIQILKRPLLTEKSTQMREAGHYVFEVDPRANKVQIKQAIETRFDVQVADVRTVRAKGKPKAQMTKKGMFAGRTSLRKKAYVRLKAGQTIDILESGNNE